jgi:hypothetical protein
MKPNNTAEIGQNSIIDQLYEIALEPQTLDAFIEAWNDAGLDAEAARKTIKSIDAFDQAYVAHLQRAETFLSRRQDSENGPDLAETLTPFDNLAAFITDPTLMVAASNAGAQQGCGFPGAN